MIIKKFDKFVESISGAEIPVGAGSIGPAYGNQVLDIGIDAKDTGVLFSETTGKYYTLYEYQELYNAYLKDGGKEDLKDFTKDNLEMLLHKAKK
jgi:hypothetical protein